MFRKLVSAWHRICGRRHWIAVSPHSSIDLGFVSETEALKRSQGFGAISFIDRERAVIVFGTQFGTQQQKDTY